MKIIPHITPEMVVDLYNKLIEGEEVWKRSKVQLILNLHVGFNVKISRDIENIKKLPKNLLLKLYKELKIINNNK